MNQLRRIGRRSLTLDAVTIDDRALRVAELLHEAG